jgi:hypothetical protein
MDVVAIECRHCRTRVESQFEPSPLVRLTPEQQDLAVKFILTSGNLKELATQEGVSYPTIRTRIDRLMEVLRGNKKEESDRRAAILDAVEEKKISADEAARLLKDS